MAVAPRVVEVEQALTSTGQVAIMASGGSGDLLKFYFYTHDTVRPHALWWATFHAVANNHNPVRFLLVLCRRPLRPCCCSNSR